MDIKMEACERERGNWLMVRKNDGEIMICGGFLCDCEVLHGNVYPKFSVA